MNSHKPRVQSWSRKHIVTKHKRFFILFIRLPNTITQTTITAEFSFWEDAPSGKKWQEIARLTTAETCWKRARNEPGDVFSLKSLYHVRTLNPFTAAKTTQGWDYCSVMRSAKEGRTLQAINRREDWCKCCCFLLSDRLCLIDSLICCSNPYGLSRSRHVCWLQCTQPMLSTSWVSPLRDCCSGLEREVWPVTWGSRRSHDWISSSPVQLRAQAWHSGAGDGSERRLDDQMKRNISCPWCHARIPYLKRDFPHDVR